MSDSVLGKRKFNWGESPEYEREDETFKKKKVSLRDVMQKACNDVKDDIEHWHQVKMSLFESGRTSRREFILP